MGNIEETGWRRGGVFSLAGDSIILYMCFVLYFGLCSGGS